MNVIYYFGLFTLGYSICAPLYGQCGGIDWGGPTCCDVGSCQAYYKQCIPSIPPPAPTPSPTMAAPTTQSPTLPPVTPGPMAAYCPSTSDWIVAYGSGSVLFNRGWRTKGGGGVASKAAFNLLGGSIEFDVLFSGVPVGINANVYTLSPTSIPISGFTQTQYCDGSRSGSDWCPEIDLLESNGNCGGAATLHTRPGTGSGLCNAWGCQSLFKYASATFHVRATFSSTGSVQITRDGVSIPAWSPMPNSTDLQVIQTTFRSRGAVLYSSQWVGWVPLQDQCGSGGSLDNAIMEIQNVKIIGSVVQGPLPSKCLL